MPEESPALPGFEDAVRRLRVPIPENYPGEHVRRWIGSEIYMGIVALSENGLPKDHVQKNEEWTPEQRMWEEAQSLMTARRLMSNHEAVFWGCPRGEFSLLVATERHPDFDTYARKFSARFNSNGKTCVTSSGNLSSCGQSGIACHSRHPTVVQDSSVDTLLDVPEGSYVITVTQMFRWKSSQMARINPAHIHYHIHCSPISDETGPLVTEIPWLGVNIPD